MRKRNPKLPLCWKHHVSYSGESCYSRLCRSEGGNRQNNISIAIVDAVKNSTPPGMFITKHSDRRWQEIPDIKARDKNTQLLRKSVLVAKASATNILVYQKKKIDKTRNIFGGDPSQIRLSKQARLRASRRTSYATVESYPSSITASANSYSFIPSRRNDPATIAFNRYFTSS